MAELQIWMNGLPVGVWALLRTGTPVLRYHEAWVRAKEGRALSLSLPFTAGLEHRGDAVAHYFENLLPDSAEIRRRLRRRFQARSGEAFDLLAAIGRDCMGAVQLLPPGAGPEGWDRNILKLPLGLVGNLRADMTDSVENEWLCAQIMTQLGIATAATELTRFGDTRALAVTRFDRRWQGIEAGAERKARFKPPEGAWIARLPQEDFCQALGVAPDRKYQADGGPSAQDCLQVLAAAEHAAEDRATFALAQLAFWLLAATDGHAKNFSLHHRRGGRFGLTPLYDVLSAWPIIGDGANRVAYPKARLAMAVRGEKSPHYRLRDVQARHWLRLAAACGPGVWDRMLQMVRGVDGVLQGVEQALPAGFPARTWEPVAAGMRRHAHEFLRSAEPGPAFAAR